MSPASSKPPSISAVVVNWNRQADLRRLLGDLYAQEQPPEQIIVVDNGSSDGSAAMVASEFRDVHLLEFDSNRGLSSGRNAGITAATSEWITLLDNDLRILDRRLLAKARQSIVDHPDIDVISFHLVQGLWTVPANNGDAYIYRMSELQGLASEGRSPSQARAYYEWFLLGGACLISRRAFDAVGRLDPHFAYGGEEWDFAYRCHARGIRLLRDPSLWAVHVQSQEMRSKTLPVLILQNMIIAQSRYMPITDLMLFLTTQLIKSAAAAIANGGFRPFVGMCRDLIKLWPSRVSSCRAPVARAVMARFYYLRMHRPKTFVEVDRATVAASTFYWHRACSRTPDQTERADFVAMNAVAAEYASRGGPRGREDSPLLSVEVDADRN